MGESPLVPLPPLIALAMESELCVDSNMIAWAPPSGGLNTASPAEPHDVTLPVLCLLSAARPAVMGCEASRANIGDPNMLENVDEEECVDDGEGVL
jgi:hypothetical protein